MLQKYFLTIFLLIISISSNAKDIKAIEITGLNSVARGVVLNNIPVERGDEIDTNTSNLIIKSLYKTSLFNDISVLEENSIIKIHLKEKPHIYSIDISGYSDAIIEPEQLNKILKNVKLSEGKIFNERTLKAFIEQLKVRYKEKGYYSMEIKKTITIDNQNRVVIKIEIEENDILLVRTMRINNSTVYDEDELLDEFEIGEPDFFIINYFSEKDQYSKNALNAGIEKIKKLYINNGYINFKVEKLITKITKDKTYIDIEINIKEGDKFYVGDVFFTGDTLFYNKEDIKDKINFEKDDILEYKLLVESSIAITKFYTNKGYAFVTVKPKSRQNIELKTVDIEFPIVLNQKIYINRIIVQGNNLTQDEVIRREVKQLEGGLYSSGEINESINNLKRLGYFSDVKVQIEKINNSNNKINIVFTVKETKTGNFTVGVSSGQSGVSVNLGVSERNFLGGGNTFNFNVSYSEAVKNYSFSFVDPYFTDDKNSINYGLSYNKLNADKKDISNYKIDTTSAHLGYGIPFTEHSDIISTMYLISHDVTCGNTFEILESKQCLSDDSREFKINSSWTKNTLNNFYNPTKGVRALASIDVSLPIGDYKYYKIDLKHDIYRPINDGVTLKVKNKLGLAQGYGDGYLPFFKRYYGGGGDSIRGFQFNTLGEEYPETGNAKGGEMSLVSSVAAISKIPFFKDNDNMRISAFIDAGSIYNKISDAKIDDIRVSSGVAFSWTTPIGPLGMVYAIPLHKKTNDAIKKFDFVIGSTF